jgi:hypothetical protein
MPTLKSQFNVICISGAFLKAMEFLHETANYSRLSEAGIKAVRASKTYLFFSGMREPTRPPTDAELTGLAALAKLKNTYRQIKQSTINHGTGKVMNGVYSIDPIYETAMSKAILHDINSDPNCLAGIKYLKEAFSKPGAGGYHTSIVAPTFDNICNDPRTPLEKARTLDEAVTLIRQEAQKSVSSSTTASTKPYENIYGKVALPPEDYEQIDEALNGFKQDDNI